MTNHDELRAQLAELHIELESALHQAPLDKDLFGQVMTDIVNIASGKSEAVEDTETLVEQLEHQASDFDVEHPRLAGLLREAMDILSKMGI